MAVRRRRSLYDSAPEWLDPPTRDWSHWSANLVASELAGAHRFRIHPHNDTWNLLRPSLAISQMKFSMMQKASIAKTLVSHDAGFHKSLGRDFIEIVCECICLVRKHLCTNSTSNPAGTSPSGSHSKKATDLPQQSSWSSRIHSYGLKIPLR